jgi:signal transduction histidine kinase
MTVLVVIGTVSLIGLFAYLGTAALSENTQRTLQERVVLAQTTARHIDYILASIQNVLTDTAAQNDWSDPARTQSALGNAYRRLNFYATRVFLLDPTGRAIAAIPPITSTVSFSDFASVTAVLNGQSFAVSRYKRPLGSFDSSTVAAAPVRDTSGNITGALVTSIDLTGPNIRTFTDPIGLGETGYMDLVDLGGVILASTRRERVGRESDHGETLVGMIRDHRQTVSACHDCHTTASAPEPQREVLAFAPLERAQWGVTVRQSEDEVFAASRQLQIRIFALMAIMLAGALVLVYLTTRSVIAPIQELTAATRQIAAGDLGTPIQVQGHDEIGTLARSFDVMRTRLNEWNRELDTRVQERTADLAKAADEISRLYAELQRKEHLRGELLHRVISVQEEERKRISRELHDETSQILVSLAYSLDNLGETLARGDAPPEIQPLLENMRALAKTGRDGLNRIIFDLRPTMLDHLGLVPALRWYAETRLNGKGIRFNVHEVGNARRLPPTIETVLFRVVQEAINNIAQHSHAQHADLHFDYSDDRIEIGIADDGQGFDPMGVASHADSRLGLGLIGMEERMSEVGGEFRLRAAPGTGTAITLCVPSAGGRNDKD